MINEPLDLRPRVLRTARDRVSVDLRGLGERLRSAAKRRQTNAAALTRLGVLRILDDEDACAPVAAESLLADASACSMVKVTLRMPFAHASSLAARAKAADQAQGRYISALLDGLPPQPRAADHASAVAALLASTDGLATLSADLNAFLRVLGSAHLVELERYRDSLMSLTTDVRQHLACAAALVAELKPSMRARQ